MYIHHALIHALSAHMIHSRADKLQTIYLHAVTRTFSDLYDPCAASIKIKLGTRTTAETTTKMFSTTGLHICVSLPCYVYHTCG